MPEGLGAELLRISGTIQARDAAGMIGAAARGKVALGIPAREVVTVMEMGEAERPAAPVVTVTGMVAMSMRCQRRPRGQAKPS
jgi:hypothetical protein